MPAPHHSVFTGWMPFLPPNKQHQITEGNTSSYELEDFVGGRFYCPRAIAGGNQRIQIREKTLEFSSTV